VKISLAFDSTYGNTNAHELKAYGLCARKFCGRIIHFSVLFKTYKFLPADE
jgi:hypothetical protein